MSAPLPRPFTSAEDRLILRRFQRDGKSCREIANEMSDRSRVAVNKRLKKLLKIASFRPQQPQAHAGAAVILSPPEQPQVRHTGAGTSIPGVCTPLVKGAKSRWYAEDDAHLLSGGSEEALAQKYGCTVLHVTRRKNALLLRERENRVNQLRILTVGSKLQEAPKPQQNNRAI